MILQLLNVLIGLSLIYIIFASIASALFEAVESLLKKRGKLLARGIKEILRKLSPDVEADLARFYEHPLINSLYEGEFAENSRKLPSYIPAERFACVVLMLAEDAGANTEDAFVRLRGYAERLLGKRPLTDGESRLKALDAEIAGHFNDSMDRVSGWFTRYARGVLLAVGILLAGAANVDTIQIIQTLSMDPVLADRVAESAAQYVEQRATSDTEFAAAASDASPGDDLGRQLEVLRENRRLAESLGVPLGWRDGEFERGAWVLEKIVGVLLSGLALSFGASFWFDILNKLVSLRNSLKPMQEGEAAESDKTYSVG